MEKKLITVLICSLLLSGHYSMTFTIKTFDLGELGRKIWQNEANQKIDLLTFWNKNEPFPSFGIGHFIWFPQNYDGPYTQTFPTLLAYLKKSGVTLPSWLETASACPWSNRNIFYEQCKSEKMIQLRQLLVETVAQQAACIVSQFEKTVSRIIKKRKGKKRKKVMSIFKQLSATPDGLYALIDYHNFKGAGTNEAESYEGHRWGLLQVVESMPQYNNQPEALKAFVATAKKLLAERVAHAPAHKPESQFLDGWYKRLDTYCS